MIEYENLRRSNEIFFSEFVDVAKKVFESGRYILGQQVTDFENKFSSFNSSSYTIGVASGLDALILAIDSFKFPAGSEIIVPSNTYVATILAILRNHCHPVLVEPDLQTYNLDPKKLEESITARTKAIVVVHLYGKSCDMDSIGEIARKYDLRIIEDCAQAHGSKFKGQNVGNFGDFGAFSFYPTKNLGAIGDGGCITTQNAQLATSIRTLRNYGSLVKYENIEIGHNSRLDELQAGLLSVKLDYLQKITAHKRRLAEIYLNLLKNDFIKPQQDKNTYDVFHIFNIRHPRRDELRDYLLKNEIKTEIHYPIPPHQQPALKEMLGHLHLPISEEIHKTTLSLPISFGHTEEEILRVVDIMNKY